MTSANVAIYLIRKGGKIVGEHSHHFLCHPHWEDLLKFQPLADHTIQWTWEDEDEAPHEKEPEALVDFLEQLVKKEEGIELRWPSRKEKREKEGLPAPRQRYLGGEVVNKKDRKRVITVVRESDNSSRNSLNECLIAVGSASWRVDWTDDTLKMERLQDKLIDSGADPDLVREFRKAAKEHYEK